MLFIVLSMTSGHRTALMHVDSVSIFITLDTMCVMRHDRNKLHAEDTDNNINYIGLNWTYRIKISLGDNVNHLESAKLIFLGFYFYSY